MNQHFLCGIPDLIQTLLDVLDVILIDTAGFIGSFGILAWVVAAPSQERDQLLVDLVDGLPGKSLKYAVVIFDGCEFSTLHRKGPDKPGTGIDSAVIKNPHRIIAFALIGADGKRDCKLMGVPCTPFLGDNYLKMGVKE